MEGGRQRPFVRVERMEGGKQRFLVRDERAESVWRRIVIQDERAEAVGGVSSFSMNGGALPAASDLFKSNDPTRPGASGRSF